MREIKFRAWDIREKKYDEDIIDLYTIKEEY